MNKKASYTPLYILVAVLAVTVAAGLVSKKPYTFHGTVITPPLPVTDFALQTAGGESFL